MTAPGTVGELLSSLSVKEREDALWLLGARLQVNRSALLLDPRRELTPKLRREWPALWRRRLAGEPLQYIAGTAPFYGREFRVGPGVLIPRPETEALVELCLSLFHDRAPRRVVDIGTGSGAIAITLKKERPHWELLATDISPAALRIARANNSLHAVGLRVEKQDLFSPALARQSWDLVVSNPPYLNFARDWVAPDVKRWEPRLALEPTAAQAVPRLGERGAWCGERILTECARARVGHTALELSPRVAYLLERRWRRHPRVQRISRAADLAGRKRFLLVAWSDA